MELEFQESEYYTGPGLTDAMIAEAIQPGDVMKFRQARLIAVVGALCGTLTACAPLNQSPPTEEELVGRWTNGDTVLVLDADMNYTLVGAPAYTAVGEGQNWPQGVGVTRDLTGAWSVEDDAVRLLGEKLFFDYSGSELMLEWGLDLGSEDPRCYQLVREASTLTPLGPGDCHIGA